MPFSIFLKSFFAQHSKYGSKDRKRIAHICYCYFRLGQSLKNLPVQERALIGLILCNQQADELLEHAKAEWNAQMTIGIHEKIDVLNASGISFRLMDIFPWKDELSDDVNHLALCASFLLQPHLFLRLRTGFETIVQQKLQRSGISFEEINASCLALPNSSKIDTVIALDREAVVQDLNSQNTGEFMSANPASLVWDCCAASGGKSMLAYDLIPNIQLTASDIRESIIQNLKKRFVNAGIANYRAMVVDLENVQISFRSEKFDLIICDAPCSGSGTWSRTPEQLAFFHPDRIDHYSTLQRKIVSNVVPYLKKGGSLVYITCSVFKKENEGTIDIIREKFSLNPDRMEILKGYDKRADTLFAARFTS